MKDCLGIINLDENENKVTDLIKQRTLPSIPIAGRYRIIDFVLSNMTNSGIESIGVFMKRKSRSLIDHLTNGRPWDLHRKRDGLRIFNFGEYDPTYDDVHNFIENIEFIRNGRKDYVLISPSYMICNIDYNKIMDEHKKSDTDITIIYKSIEKDNKKFYDCDFLKINNKNEVTEIYKTNNNEDSHNLSMEMYIMKTNLFINIINESITNGLYRKIKDYIKNNLNSLKVIGSEFKGYLSCINSVNAYFNSNMDLLDEKINSEIFYSDRPIYTKVKDEGPTKYSNSSNISNSIVANGSYIEGEVSNCIIGRRVHIREGSIVKNSIVMQNSVIGMNSIIDNVIVSKGSRVAEKKELIGRKNRPITIQKK